MLEEFAKAGLPIPERLIEIVDWDRLGRFLEFLRNKNEAGGFFSKGDAERILERHLYENVIFMDYVVSRCKVSRETNLADAGSGPGLPGYLFACLKQPPRITLIDSSRRRLGIVEEHHRTEGSPASVRFEFSRLEEMRTTFSLIVMRALIPFPQCVELVCHLVGKGGFLVLSGSRFQETDLSRFGFVSRETYVPSELSFLGARTFLLLEKTGKQDSLYPRPWKIIQQEVKEWKESTP